MNSHFPNQRGPQRQYNCCIALTLTKNEQDPQVREDFECINTKGSQKKYLLIGLGDFSAKTESCHVSFQEEIGKFGKGNKYQWQVSARQS